MSKSIITPGAGAVQTGYFGNEFSNTQSPVHIAQGGKALCGANYPKNVFQWCAQGINTSLLTCEGCIDLARQEAKHLRTTEPPKRIARADFLKEIKVWFKTQEGGIMESWTEGIIVGYDPSSDKATVRQGGVITHQVLLSKCFDKKPTE